MERNPNQKEQRDKQLERLAGQMRDTGVAPDRDLWPGIQAAINRKDQESGPGKRRRQSGNWLRMAAVAAALTVMLAAGWFGIHTIGGDPIAGLQDTAQRLGGFHRSSGLSTIDQALDELTLALADDPENRNLTQLVLMVHKTRGNLLRRNSENLVRD